MDLHDRVMEILDGRIKMGAGAPRKKKAPRKRDPVLRQVPPMYEVPNSLRGQMITPLAQQYVGQNPKITDDMLKHHYPVHAETLGTDPHDPELMAALQDLVSHKEPSVRKAAGVVARGVYGDRAMPLVGYGVQMAGTNGMYSPGVRAGRQVSKNYGGQIKCRKGCKHIRCAMVKEMRAEGVQMAGGIGPRGAVCGGKKRCPKGCHCTKCKSATRKGKGKDWTGEHKSNVKKAGKKYPYEGRMRDHRWIDFVKEFAKLNDMSYKDAMKAAAPYYKDRSPLDKRDAPKEDRGNGISVPKAMHIGRVKMGAAKAKAKPKKKRPESEWVRYVKEFAKLNDMSYKDAMKQAGPSYHAQA